MRNLLLATAATALAAGTALAADPPGKGITMYMQMGGNPGDGATLARQTGAAAAAQALGLDGLNEQFSGWAPEKMIEQFKQALAAKPSCIAIMGHPGNEAFMDLVKQAVDQGVEVTHGNAPLSEIQAAFGPKGFGYAGVDLYQGGKLTAERMIEVGQLKVRRRGHGLWRVQPGRARPVGEGPGRHAGGGRPRRSTGWRSPRRSTATPRSPCPVLAAYVQSHPDLKAIGTQHGWRHRRAGRGAEEGRQEAGRDHGRRHRPGAGHHRRPAVRLRQRHPRPAPLPAGLPAGRCSAC